MGWGFRKSRKIAPGTRVNVSRSGVSVTNRVGKTGLYHRTQVVGGAKRGSGCLPTVIGAFLAIGIIGNLIGVNDKETAETPTPAPTVTATPIPTATPEPTTDPLEELRQKMDETQKMIEAMHQP